MSLPPPGITEVRSVELAGPGLQAGGGMQMHSTQKAGAMHIPDCRSKGAVNKRIHIRLE